MIIPRLFSVDPGTRFTSVAMYNCVSKRFMDVGGFPSEAPTLDMRIRNMYAAFRGRYEPDFNVDRIVVEVPRVYPDQKKKVDPEDLIQLTLVAGAFMSACFASKSVRPAEWKGQLPKEVCHRRMGKCLDRDELDQMRVAVSMYVEHLQHNLLDAGGIGLFELGRFRPE